MTHCYLAREHLENAALAYTVKQNGCVPTSNTGGLYFASVADHFNAYRSVLKHFSSSDYECFCWMKAQVKGLYQPVFFNYFKVPCFGFQQLPFLARPSFAIFHVFFSPYFFALKGP